MPWSLAIHHIDLGSVGDSTVIVARFPAAGGNPSITRSVLIDGGCAGGADVVDAYLQKIKINQVDVIVVTHYEQDHFYGISRLLQSGKARYNNAILYDGGRLPADREERLSDRGGKRSPVNTEYFEYLQAINTKVPPFVHATARVNSFDIVQYDPANDYLAVIPRGLVNGAFPPGNVVRSYLEPHWLIGKDVMWGNGGDGLAGRPAWAVTPPPAYAPNPPSLVCIAANKYVRQDAAGNVRFLSNAPTIGGMAQGEVAETENVNDNAKSLGFVLTFNNFRYYTAGDLEWPQEDGYFNRNCSLPANQVVQNGVKFYLNGTDDTAGRILAMKTSHHGADTASSRAFVSRLRPSAAFISTGAGNKHKHPGQLTVNVLDGYAELPVLSTTVTPRHPPTPPPAPLRAVPHYLTGYQDRFNLLRLGGDASQTAGDPDNNIRGDIKILVTEEESTRPVEGQIHLGTYMAASYTAGAVGLGFQLADLHAIADAAACLGVAHAVAEVLGVSGAVVDHALAATAQLGDDYTPAEVVRQGVANAAKAAAPQGADAVRNAVLAVDPKRLAAIGDGAAEAIAAAVTNPTARSIRTAATGAQPPASDAAATAAAVAATTAAGLGWGPDDLAYAVAAAFGAVAGGATGVEAATIAAAITATVKVATTKDTVLATIRAAVHNVFARPLSDEQAAVAGAVAGVAHYRGTSTSVSTATRTALLWAGVANAADVAQTAANQVTVPPTNTLFRVSYTSVNGLQTMPHTG